VAAARLDDREVRPVTSAFVGAVIGSKQTKSLPGGANTCAKR
jgi:hypothetical protein